MGLNGLLLSDIKVLKTNYNKKLINCLNQNVLHHVVVRVTHISYNHSKELLFSKKQFFSESLRKQTATAELKVRMTV